MKGTVLESLKFPLKMLARRFALRLETALDCADYPVQLTERSELVAAMMKRCPEEVAAIVRGDALPSFTHLYELCLLTDQEPGYFLDSQVRHASHRMAIVSPPFPSREDLAVCLPREFNDLLENRGSLIYELAYTDHGYGIEAGDFVIVKSYKEPECIQVGMLYFMIKAIGFEIRRCIEIKGNRAYFDTSGFSGRPMSLVIKRHLSAVGRPPTRLSQVVATWRHGKPLQMRC